MTSRTREEKDKQRDMADIMAIFNDYPQFDFKKLFYALIEEGYYENRFKNLTGDDKFRWEMVEQRIFTH